MTPTWLADPAAPLLAVSEALGIGTTTWAGREQPERLAFVTEDLPVAATEGLDADRLRALALAYGDALTCRFRLGGMTVLEAGPAVDDADLAAYRREVEGSPTVGLDMVLDKRRLVDLHLDPPPTCRLLLYLFPQALERACTGSLVDLEGLLWPDEAGRKAVVLVPGREIWLDGPFLAVVGGEAVADWRSVLPAAPPDAERVRWVHAACREALNWQDDWLLRLTPLHLTLDGRAGKGDVVLDALLVHRANAAILYTADRTVSRSGQWVATYADSLQSVDVLLGDPTRALDVGQRTGAAALGQLAEWAYDPVWHANRLTSVQAGVSRVLRFADQLPHYLSLLRSAPAIFSDLQWHWKGFVAGQLDVYSAEVRDLENAVADTVQEFADQTAKLTDRLFETLLAAIAVLLGSFVAALFEDEFDATVFRIGVGAYALYVLLFPLALGTLHRRQCLQDLKTAFVARRGRFEQRLPVDRVEEIVGQRVEACARRACRWVWGTAAIYLVVVVLAVSAAICAPDWVAADSNGSAAVASAQAASEATPASVEGSSPVPSPPAGP